MNDKLLRDKNFVLSSTIIKYVDKDLSLKDFLVLMYFINSFDNSFDAEKIANVLNISLEDVMTSVSDLMTKELISLESGNDIDGRMVDIISLDNFYKKIESNLDSVIKENEKDTIFDLIAKEFDKKLSPIDCEIINGWLDIGTPEELIKEALKEASYNGVKTLAYIDKIIFEWSKKGFKTVDDVRNHLKKKDNNKEKEEDLFDYDWLDDDE